MTSTELAIPGEVVPASRAQAQVVEDRSPLANVQLHLVNSMDKVIEFKRWLGERREGILCYDTESEGLKPERHKLRLCQFGDMRHGWAIPWEEWGGVAREVLTTYEEELGMHNSSHDVRHSQTHIKGWKPQWHKIRDTMAEAHILDPTRPKGLKALGAREVDAKAVAGQDLLKETMSSNGWDWATVPIDHPHYWVYGALDPVLTSHIDHKYWPMVQAAGAMAAYDLEMGAIRVCANMMLRGARIDRAYCEEKIKQLRTYASEAREWLRSQFGIKNATSNMQLLAYFQSQGVVFEKLAKSGKNYAMDKEVLDWLASFGDDVMDESGTLVKRSKFTDVPAVAATVLKIRKAEKICGSYLENFIEFADENDYVHCNINTMGAKTGRMSVTDPALQTLQRDDPTVRQAFIASPGHTIITCDADQIEMRLAAHFSEDEGLIQAFLDPGDFFCGVASRLFNEDIKKGDPRRQITKNTSYGRLYGAEAPTIARTAKVTPEVAQAFINRMNEAFPGLAALMENTKKEARENKEKYGQAFITTPHGRRLPQDGEREYALLNFKIQSFGAELLKKGLVDLDAAGLGPYMVVPIHDEIVTDVPKEDEAEAKHLIESTLNDETTFRVPLTWSADVFGERWSTKG